MSSYTLKTVAEHSTPESAWIIVENNVYDITDFAENHPGGKKIILKQAGKDATELFWQFHSKKILAKTALKYLIGPVAETAKL